MEIKNVLFVHPLEGNAYEIFKAFDRNKEINVIPLLKNKIKTNSTLLDKIKYKLRIPSDRYEINKKLHLYDLTNIDILFVIKGNEIKPKTIKDIKKKYPNIKLINFSLDDMYARHNRSFYYTHSIKLYDLVVTTKSYNLNELPLLGSRNIMFVYQGFSKDIHKPIYNSNLFKHDILFIGYPEKERIESILYLAKNGFQIDIYGYPNAWEKSNIKHKNIVNHKNSLFGEKYSEAISNSKITLCFLRKINRDLHTSRSIEIPACKGFMIAERTNEHLDLFEENKEAVYFSNDCELLEKVKYYLENEKERLSISNNGYHKCINKDYSYDNRIIEILKKVENL